MSRRRADKRSSQFDRCVGWNAEIERGRVCLHHHSGSVTTGNTIAPCGLAGDTAQPQKQQSDRRWCRVEYGSEL